MKKVIMMLLAVAVSFAAISDASASNKGKHRYGGYNSHGKGSRYY